MYLPIFLSGKDVAKGLIVSIPTAYRRMSEYRQKENHPKYRKIQVLKFLEFMEVDIELFYKNLNQKIQLNFIINYL